MDAAQRSDARALAAGGAVEEGELVWRSELGGPVDNELGG